MPLAPFRVGLLFAAGPAWFQSKFAQEAGMGQAFVAFQGALTPEIFSIITTEASIGVLGVSDNAGFHQRVVDMYGVVSTQGSTLHVGYSTLTAGLRTPLLVMWRHPNQIWFSGAHAYVRMGGAYVFGDREIDNCVDCSVFSPHFHPGTVLAFGLHYEYRGGVRGSLTIGYRHYFGGSSLQGEVPIGLELWFG